MKEEKLEQAQDLARKMIAELNEENMSRDFKEGLLLGIQFAVEAFKGALEGTEALAQFIEQEINKEEE